MFLSCHHVSVVILAQFLRVLLARLLKNKVTWFVKGLSWYAFDSVGIGSMKRKNQASPL